LRWRKEQITNPGYLIHSPLNQRTGEEPMDANTSTNQPGLPNGATLISEVLSGWPASLPLFVKYHLDCIGCSMAPFCTLQEAADLYGFSLQSFITDLSAQITPSNHNRKE
jgi:hybrid cluster-associated redox disulfide protein